MVRSLLTPVLLIVLAALLMPAALAADVASTWSRQSLAERRETLDEIVPGFKWALWTGNPDVGRIVRTSSSPMEVFRRLVRLHDVRPRPVESLWITQPELAATADADLWSSSHAVAFGEDAPWVVPADPDWREDPYASDAWKFRYQSLGWLIPVAELGDWTTVSRLVLDWIGSNPRKGTSAPFAWYDHSTAYRTDALVRLYETGLRTTLDPIDHARLAVALFQHGQALRQYIDEHRFHGNNHNLFHAVSLHNLALSFPELDGAGEWRDAARTRISTLLMEMVDPVEGVSLEQAIDYHYLALDLFLSADDYLRRGNGQPLDEDERQVLVRMARFGALVARPDGTVPAIGDTSQPSGLPRALYDRLRSAGLLDAEAQFVLSSGADGVRPADAIVLPGAGYAILRPNYSPGSAWASDLHVVVDIGPPRRVHGHHDGLNVVAFAGEDLLIDSGGPYRYGNPAHFDFIAPRAHNLVVVDDVLSLSGGVAITGSGDTPSMSFLQGEIAPVQGVVQRRTVVVLKPSTLVVVDQVRGDGATHAIDAYWHLPEGVEGHPGGGGFESVRAGATVLAAAVVSSHSLESSVVEGRTEPSALGWITPAQGLRRPAPVVRYAAATGEPFWMVTVFQPHPGVASPSVRASPRGVEELAIEVEVEGRSFSILVGPAGMVREAIHRADGLP